VVNLNPPPRPGIRVPIRGPLRRRLHLFGPQRSSATPPAEPACLLASDPVSTRSVLGPGGGLRSRWATADAPAPADLPVPPDTPPAAAGGGPPDPPVKCAFDEDCQRILGASRPCEKVNCVDNLCRLWPLPDGTPSPGTAAQPCDGACAAGACVCDGCVPDDCTDRRCCCGGGGSCGSCPSERGCANGHCLELDVELDDLCAHVPAQVAPGTRVPIALLGRLEATTYCAACPAGARGPAPGPRVPNRDSVAPGGGDAGARAARSALASPRAVRVHATA